MYQQDAVELGESGQVQLPRASHTRARRQSALVDLRRAWQSRKKQVGIAGICMKGRKETVGGAPLLKPCVHAECSYCVPEHVRHTDATQNRPLRASVKD